MSADQKQKPQMPEAESNGFVATLNQTGYMTGGLDPFSLAWAGYAAATREPALEIGPAYGVATLEALRLGAHITALDLDPRHLEILKERTPADHRERLKTQSGYFPGSIDFEENSFGSILACRILHFLRGNELEEAARKTFRWLKPGGRLFAICETPYLTNFKDFIPIFEKRLADGEKWPGICENPKDFDPIRAKDLDVIIHFMMPDILRRPFEEAGFRVLDARTISRPDLPQDVQYDGRESVGLVVEKP